MRAWSRVEGRRLRMQKAALFPFSHAFLHAGTGPRLHSAAAARQPARLIDTAMPYIDSAELYISLTRAHGENT
jgi:hypothetical protein